MHTGRVLENVTEASPCRRGYAKFCEEMGGWCQPVGFAGGRSSWDPMAVVYAVRGMGSDYSRTRGYYEINRQSGGSVFHRLSMRPSTSQAASSSSSHGPKRISIVAAPKQHGEHAARLPMAPLHPLTREAAAEIFRGATRSAKSPRFHGAVTRAASDRKKGDLLARDCRGHANREQYRPGGGLGGRLARLRAPMLPASEMAQA